MFIVPMNSNININRINSITQNLEKTPQNTEENNGIGFKEIFQNVIQNVEDTEAATKMDAYNLSIGNMDDMHYRPWFNSEIRCLRHTRRL